jgi:long-chain fatty acid transport protein
MNRNRKTTRNHFALTPLCLLLAAPLAHATDGYFANGYGLKSIGMGGAAVAVALEPFGGAVNPGAMSFLDTQFQIGAAWFSPDRSASRTGSGTPDGTPTGGWGIDGSATSGSTNFVIPEIGFNWRYRPDLAFGITVFGNGGMNTDYPGDQIPAQSVCAGFNPNPGPYNLLCGNGRLGVDMMQLMIAPYASWQFTKGHSVGIAPVFAYQRFKVEGLQAFDNPLLSTSPGSVTNNGTSDSWGAGVRIGYMGELSKQFAVGAAYATKINMGEFDGYKGLFAQGGGFDIPSNFTIGAELKLTDQWLFALDFERIFYSDAKSVHNPSSLIGNCLPPAMGGAGNTSNCLGGSDGAGFGWKDIDVWKVGVQYVMSPQWTLRAGYNHSGNPVQPQDVTFNILAPGIVQNQWSLGASWKLDKQSEITGAFMYAQNNSVTGPSLYQRFGAPASTTETIRMKEYLLGIAYSHWY